MDWVFNLLRKIKTFVKKLFEYIYYIFTYGKTHPPLNYHEINKVIFIAHPDDEMIFFGGQLLTSSGWLVVCITNGGNYVRQQEFMKAMESIGAKYVMFNFRDGNNIVWNSTRILKKIKKILARKDQWEKIITHNEEGEYGHKQHIQLNKIVKEACKTRCNRNLFVSQSLNELQKAENILHEKIRNKKREIFLTSYLSQQIVIRELPNNFIYEDITLENL